MIDSYILEFDKDFTHRLAEYDSNAFGVKTRCGLIGTRMYKGLYPKTPKGDSSSYIGKDEFDEPDYKESSNDFYYYKRVTKGLYVRYDEDNNEITDTL